MIPGASTAAALTRSAQRAAGSLLDLVYPPRCLVCDRYDAPPVCERCASAFTELAEPLCERCGRSVEPDSDYCRTCTEARQAHGEWAFASARTAALFEGPMRQAVHRLKYQGCEALGPLLGAYLANRVAADGLLPPDVLSVVTAVVAVPMDSRKRRARGFNQARLLAAPVAEILGVPLLPESAVSRTPRSAQVGLTQDERRRNVISSFRCAAAPEEPRLRAARLLLIDDVFTTGATVHACAATLLRDAGAESVHVVTLAGGG